MDILEPIKNFEDLYQINPKGEIYGLKRGKILKQHLNRNGYYTVTLCKGGKDCKFITHRLLALQYIENTENKPTVDHINRIRTDNRLENLRWATQKEQMNNTSRNTTKEQQQERSKKYKRQHYIDNKEEYDESNKIWRESHVEEMKDYKKKFYEKNKEEINLIKKENYIENRDEILDRNKKWRDEHKEELNKKAVEYGREHKEEIKARKQRRVTCECGIEIAHDSRNSHLKTIRHKDAMAIII